MSNAKQLGKIYGGTWTYDGQASWWCDDGKRSVSRTNDGYDIHGDPCGTAYWLYGDGTPRRVYWGANAATVNSI